ncbi:MAG: Protein-glutamine gamma-glutamyltransferase, partial [Acidobacteriota bacterium]|nr:Protein-glutamine gamma-glutamyltransferase [Acidobacteriota bacterium]
MTYAREKRLLLGLAALLAPLPLPFNQMLEWTALALFEAGVVAFLVRAARGADGPDDPGRWLSNRALNLLGLAYLPILVLDIAATGRIQMLRPVL